MLGGKGYYRGSSVLVSGSAGTGKTSLAAAFADAACRRGERCLYLAFEEAPSQIIRNMASIGFDLGQWVRKGLLRFQAVRSTLYGLEQHLVTIHKAVSEFKPAVVIIDPITNLLAIGDEDRGQGDADADDRLPEEPGDHGPVHQPHRRRRARPSRPRWASRR